MTDERDEAAEAVDDAATATVLARLAPILGDPAMWDEPPPELADSIIAAVVAERHSPTGVHQPATTLPAPGDVVRPPRRAPWLAVIAAAVALVAIGVIGVIATRSGDDDTTEALDIEGTALAPDARAAAFVVELGAGVAINLEIEGLPPAPMGLYYQGWVRSDRGELVSVGTFHMRAGDSNVTLWSGVEVDEYPTLTVSLEREGAGPESSGQVVLRGSLVP